MIRETDLPCSDCGANLVECDIPARVVTRSPSMDAPIPVAECPECGSRYFPERALSRLYRGADRSSGERD